MIKKWDLNNKQYDWLQLLYRCDELRIIKLISIEHEVIHHVLNEKQYDLYEKILLNKLRDKYKKDYLMTELDKQNSPTKRVTILGGTTSIYPTTSYYIRGNKLIGKPTVISTLSSNTNATDFQDMWMYSPYKKNIV